MQARLSALSPVFGAAGILCTMRYVQMNVTPQLDAVGLQFLAIAFMASLMSCLLASPSLKFSINSAGILVGLFCLYLAFKVGFERPERGFKVFLIGTDGGIMFATSLGVALAMLLDSLYRATNRILVTCAVISAIGYGIWIVARTLMFYGSSLAANRVLSSIPGSYQRVANLQLISILVIGSLIMISSRGPSPRQVRNRTVNLVLLTLFGIFSIMNGLLAQMVGSNAGLITTLLVLAVTLVYGRSSRTGRSIHESRSKLPIGRAAVALIAIAVLAWASLRLFGIELSQLRITGFGGAQGLRGLSSVSNRLDLWATIGEQLRYDPVFGDLRVDALTVGSGRYVHSLVAVQTHAGIVGSVLVLMIVSASLRFVPKSPSAAMFDSVYRQYGRAIMVCFIAWSIGSAFFNWLPLWLSIGLFGVRVVSVHSPQRPIHVSTPEHATSVGNEPEVLVTARNPTASNRR